MKIKQVVEKYQSGQAILLIAVSAVGLIAMMGLAIDGGRLLLLRRDTQNAADAAAIAAARALCTGDDPVAAADAAALQNGFDDNEIDNWVDVLTPPENTSATIDSACLGCYIEVKITGEIPPTFIGLVYGGELAATSKAIGTCNPDLTGTSGTAPEVRATWAMGDTCSNSNVSITGSNITIEGGIHSNGTAKINPSSAPETNTVCGASSVVTDNDSGTAIVQGEDKLTWEASCDADGSSDPPLTFPGGTCSSSCFTPADVPDIEIIPEDGDPYLTDKKTDWPIDDTISDYNDPTAVGTAAYEANLLGEYHVVADVGQNCSKFNDYLVANHVTGSKLDDGIYYAECDLTFNNTSAADGLEGNVTFITTGTIDVTNSDTSWQPYVNNLLMYSTANEGCGSVIKFSGNSNSWNGNIFAPNGSIQMSASSNSTNLQGCLIGYAIEIAGSSNSIICDTGDATSDPVPGMWLSE